MKLLRLLPAALIIATVAPAHAGLFDDEEARARIEKMQRDADARFTRIESSAATASRAQLELANQNEALRGEIAKLRGQIEVLTNDLEQAQKRQRDFYVDLDNRLRKIETAAAEAKKDDPAKPDPQAETRDYQGALTLFQAAKYKEAAAAFSDFIRKYPASGFLPNAHYWLGGALMQGKDYKGAADAYQKVATAWPNDAKAPDALLGLAGVQQEAGEAKAARSTLESVVARYPGTTAAQLAKDRLKPAPKKK